MSLKAFDFERNPARLSVLNQLLLPYETLYVNVDSIAPGPGSKFSGFDAIRGMYTRGAPAIMLVGCFSVVVELDRALHQNQSEVLLYDTEDEETFSARLLSRIDTLVSSRPTAVNLANACNELKRIIETSSVGGVEQIYNEVLAYAQGLYRTDLESNMAIAANGVRYIYDQLEREGFEGPFSVLTICNTGSLATSGYGTALGIIRGLHEKSKLASLTTKCSRVYACETRPYNQGSRLTAYELKHDGIPFSLITDNMAAFLLESSNSGKATERGLEASPVKFIIAGADRIVVNGDVANKIGTFQLSLLASVYPGVKFIIAAPTTTIDTEKLSGDEITIEERSSNELAEVRGAEVDANGNLLRDPTTGHIRLAKVRVAPEDIEVWNPAFDVTPHQYIDCIVTQNGYMEKHEGKFNMNSY